VYYDADSATINGISFGIKYDARKAAKIEYIRLLANTKVSEADCLEQFAGLVDTLARKYGAFDRPPKKQVVPIVIAAITLTHLVTIHVVKRYDDRWLTVVAQSFGFRSDCSLWINYVLGTPPPESANP
jgi:hypothetical protein